MMQWDESQCPLCAVRFAAGDLTADVQTPNLGGAEVSMVQSWGVVIKESQPGSAGVAQPDVVDKAVKLCTVIFDEDR